MFVTTTKTNKTVKAVAINNIATKRAEALVGDPTDI